MVTNPFGQGLSVRVSADTGSFERGINDAIGELQQFGGTAIAVVAPIEALEGRTDELGDELADVGREGAQAAGGVAAAGGAAGASTGTFTSLAASTEGLALSFGSLTSSMTGTVVLLGAIGAAATGLLATLVPLAAGLATVTAGATALAGAFGTIIGTGVIAFGQEQAEQNEELLEQTEDRIEHLEDLQDTESGLTETQQERLASLEEQRDRLEDQVSVMGALQGVMQDLARELRPIIVEFGQQFVPLIEDAIDAVPQLVRNIFDAAGGMDVFVRALRAFGREAFDAIPQVVAVMRDLAEQALPVARDFFTWLRDNALGIFNEMVSSTEDIAPAILDFTDAFMEALPDIEDLGTAILNDVLPPVSDLVETFGDFLNNVLNDENQSAVGNIVDSMDDLAPAAGDFVDELLDLIPTLIFFVDRVLPVLQPALEDLATVMNAVAGAMDTVDSALEGIIDRWERIPEPIRELIVQGAEMSVRSLARQPVGPGGATGVVRAGPQAAQVFRGGAPAVSGGSARGPVIDQQQEVRVNVEGTSPLAQAFEELITAEITTMQDRNQRRTGPTINR